VHSIPTLGWGGVLARVVVAAALGGLIGLERELDEKSAGLRTHILVALGSALFTIVSAFGFREFLTSGQAIVRADPARIAAQVVTGIGFIGAGVIFRQGLSVRGLTTAASLWLVAAIGMAAGAGYWQGAVVATAAGLVSLRPLEWLKDRLLPRRARRALELELGEDAPTAPVVEALEQHAQVGRLARVGDRLQVELEPFAGASGKILAAAAELPSVREAAWVSGGRVRRQTPQAQ
jgi:putative Mg2+ transporter-C (MgtC) family protein